MELDNIKSNQINRDNRSESSFSAHTIEDSDQILTEIFIDNTERILRKSGVEILPQINEEPDNISYVYRTNDLESYQNSEIILNLDYNIVPSFADSNNNDATIFSLSPYVHAKYKCKKRFFECCNFLRETLLKPMSISFRLLSFYPILFLDAANVFVSTIFFFQIYALSLEKDNEANFFLPLIGFGQIVHFALIPWCENVSKTKLKIMFGLNLLLFAAILGGQYITIRSGKIIIKR